MSYTITKYKDVFTLNNTGIESFDFTVKKLTDCVNYTDEYTATLPIGESANIVFSGDGLYQVVIDDVISVIKYYLELEKSLISDLYDVLCNCEYGCADCTEDKCEELLITQAKMEAYKRVVFPQYTSHLDAVKKETNCLITKQIYCCIHEEKYNGIFRFNSKLIKQLLALDYLALYFNEFDGAGDDTVYQNYIKTKFNVTNLFCCVSSLGIDIPKIDTLIHENMGVITINSGAYVNLPPSSVGDYTLGVTNRAVTVLTMAMFTSLTTPAYADPEGDAANAVRIDTLPVDGVLYLDGVPVVVSDIILKTDIDLGLLTYESPDQDAFDSDTIGFSVRDAGSGLFTT